MARIERLRKIRKLESRTASVASEVTQLTEERKRRVFEQALALLDMDDLAALGPLVDAAIEGGSAASSATVNLWEYAADQRDLKAIRSLALALDAVVGKDEELMRGERRAR